MQAQKHNMNSFLNFEEVQNLRNLARDIDQENKMLFEAIDDT